MIKSSCHKCNNVVSTYFDSFCSNCGTKLENIKEVKYTGVCKSRALYKFTFEITKEFNTLKEAEEAVNMTSFGIDADLFNNYNFKFVKFTALAPEYPYYCTTCKNVVSDKCDGACIECGSTTWEKIHNNKIFMR